MYLSLVIPAYNEAERLEKTLLDAAGYFARQSYDAEIIVVDDGSADATARVARACRDRISTPLLVESLPKNRGKGYAVRQGMLTLATGAFRFYYDADGSTPIGELDKCAALFHEDADIVIGSRAVVGADIRQRQVWYREFMGRCFNLLERVMGLTPYRDTQCGFKGFTADAAKACFSRQTLCRFSFDAELLFIARQRGLRIVEVPVQWINSPASRVSPITDAARMFWDLLVIRMRGLTGRYT